MQVEIEEQDKFMQLHLLDDFQHSIQNMNIKQIVILNNFISFINLISLKFVFLGILDWEKGAISYFVE